MQNIYHDVKLKRNALFLEVTVVLKKWSRGTLCQEISSYIKVTETTFMQIYIVRHAVAVPSGTPGFSER